MKNVTKTISFMKKTAVSVLFILCVLLLSACASRSGEESSSDVPSTSSSQEISTELSSARDRFVEKYGYDFNVLLFNPEDSFYEFLLNNPIDAWRDSRTLYVESTWEMIKNETRVYNNWIRECNSSIEFLCERYPDLSDSILAEQSAWETYVNSYIGNTEMIAHHTLIEGTSQWVCTAAEKADAARQRAFHLAYLEYITLWNDSVSSGGTETVDLQALEIIFS